MRAELRGSRRDPWWRCAWERPGARWKRNSAEGGLQLRVLVLVLSDRWRSAMARSMSRLRKPVKALPRGETLAA